MTGNSASTFSKIFVGWCVFSSSVYQAIDMTPLLGFVDTFLPKQFVEAGCWDIALLGDATINLRIMT